jgi:hypothetical protein
MSDETKPDWMAGPPPPPPSASDPAPTPPAGSRPGPPRSAPATPDQGSGIGLQHVKDASPWVLGAAAIVIAIAVTWLSDLLRTFQHAHGATTQQRMLTFFGIGQILWAVALLLGAFLLAAGRRFEIGGPAGPSPLTHLTTLGVVAASAAVGVFAALSVVVELTNFGHGLDQAFSGLIAYLAVVPIAGAALWWSLHLRN